VTAPVVPDRSQGLARPGTGVQGHWCQARVATCRAQATEGVRGIGREHVVHVVDAVRAGARHARDVLQRRVCVCALLLEQFQWSSVSFLPDLTVPDPYHILHRTHIEGGTVYCVYTCSIHDTEIEACDTRQRQVGKPGVRRATT
jgi:hypothetical protein